MDKNKLEEELEDFKEEPLTPKVKIIAGGMSASIYLLMALSMTPITYYYNVILGLNAGLIAYAWLLFAIWNGLNDPLFAIFQERFISKKYGRRIPYLRFGAPFLGFFFILLWMPFLIVDVNQEMLLFLYFLITLLAFDTIYTFMSSANGALFFEITFTQKERTNLAIYTNLVTAIATGIIIAGPLIFLYNQDDGVNPLLYPAFSIICLVCVFLIILGSYTLKEKPYLKYEKPLGFIEGIKTCFKNKPWLISQGVGFFGIITGTIFLTGILYYILIVLSPPFHLVIMFLLTVFLSFIIFVIFLNKLLDKFGLKNTYLLCVLIGTIGFILLFFIGWNTFPGWNIYYALIPLVLVTLGHGTLSILGPTFVGENIDYDEKMTGKRREVTYGGIGALFGKPAISIANAIFLFVIAIYGFNPDSGTNQSANAILGLMIAFTLISGISFAISGIFLLFWPLHGPEWDKIKEELKEIHLKKEIEFLKGLREKGVID